MTTFTFTINWLVVLSLFLMAAGFVMAGMGAIAGADPEGRGGGYFWMIPVGAIIFFVSLAYCLFRLGAVFGFWL